MSTTIISWIRTIVPIGVASALSWLLVTFGLQLDKASEDGLVVGITGLLIAVYYTGVRALEEKWPKLGVLLGVAQTPDGYSQGEAVQIESVTPSIVTLDPVTASAFTAYLSKPLADPNTPIYNQVLNEHRP